MSFEGRVLLSGTSYAVYDQTYSSSKIMHCRFAQKQ